MIKQTQKIKTFLPCFSGFYETIYQFDAENVIYNINQTRKENNLGLIDYNALEVNYKSYEMDVALELCQVIASELENFVESIEFENIFYPKQYNFCNNSVDVVIIPKIEAIKAFIYANKAAFEKHLVNNYTSYDGFISHFSNRFSEWEQDTSNFENFNDNQHYLGAILEFIAQETKVNETDIFYQVTENITEDNYILNYTDLINNPSCIKCQDIISDIEVLKTIKKYKEITGKNPKTCLCEKCLSNI